LITSTNELLKKMSDEEVVRRERQHQQAITTVPRSSSEVNLNQTPQQMQPVGGQLRQRAPSTRSVYGGGGGGSEKGVGVVGSGGGKESPFGGADDFKFTPPAMKPQKIDSANYCLISGLGIIQLENNKNGAENGGHRLGSEITTIAAAGASKRSKAPEYM
jgi:hypothetical protein